MQFMTKIYLWEGLPIWRLSSGTDHLPDRYWWKWSLAEHKITLLIVIYIITGHPKKIMNAKSCFFQKLWFNIVINFSWVVHNNLFLKRDFPCICLSRSRESILLIIQSIFLYKNLCLCFLSIQIFWSVGRSVCHHHCLMESDRES